MAGWLFLVFKGSRHTQRDGRPGKLGAPLSIAVGMPRKVRAVDDGFFHATPLYGGALASQVRWQIILPL